jgi:hypothetical protein
MSAPKQRTKSPEAIQIGARCKQARDLLSELEGKEVTRGAMQARAKLSAGHYEGIEDGDKFPGIEVLAKLAKAFAAVRCSPEWLAWGRGSAPRVPNKPATGAPTRVVERDPQPTEDQ